MLAIGSVSLPGSAVRQRRRCGRCSDAAGDAALALPLRRRAAAGLPPIAAPPQQHQFNSSGRTPPPTRTYASSSSSPASSSAAAHAQLLAAEKASLSRLPREELARALARLGEPPPPPDAPKGALAARLAARRLAERARVVRLPLRLTFAGRRSSRRYLTVPLDVGDLGFVDFLLEAGSYECLISPELRGRLGLGPADGSAVRALDSRGPTLRQRVALPEMWLGTFKLPAMSACVSDLPVSRAGRRQQTQQTQQQQEQQRRQQQQQQQDQQQQQQDLEQQQQRDGREDGGGAQPPQLPPAATAAGPGGMLGVRALSCFDVDVDWAGNRLAFHPAGHAAAGLLDVRGLRRVACGATKAGLVVLSASLNGSAPILGILDLSASVSILNWEAAELLGIECADDADGECDSGSSGSSGSSSSGGSKGVGCFGSIRVRPSEQLTLGRPAPAPAPGGGAAKAPPSHPLDGLGGQLRLNGFSGINGSGINGASSSSIGSSSDPQQQQEQHERAARRQRGRASPSSQGMRVYELYAHELKIVLGATGSGATGSGSRSGSGSGSSKSSGSSGSGGGAAVAPPAKLAVAHLKGLAQVGLAGRPAIVIGGDLWGRERMVLCLKSGVMYL